MCLFSISSYAHDIIIYSGVVAPGHGNDVVGGLNDTDKRFLTMLMKTVQLPNAATNNYQMVMHTSTEKSDISVTK